MLTKFLNPKNDVAFKKVFGSEEHKDILIHFINDILGFKDKDQIQTVTFLPTAQEPEIASRKQSIVDVLCEDANKVSYIIEMQVTEFSGFEKRAQYYASKAYARQLKKGDKKYQNLKEVIFIAIVDYILFKDKAAYISKHHILDTETNERDLKDFSFTFLELPKFTKTKNDKLDNTIEQWCVFFKYAEDITDEDLKHFAAGDPIIKEAYDAINKFNWSEPELEAYETDLKHTMDQRAILDAAESKGEARGETKKQFEFCRKLLAEGMTVDFIARVTGLSEAEVMQINQHL